MKGPSNFQQGLPQRSWSLLTFARPDAPKAGGLLAAVGICAGHVNLWSMVVRAIEAKTFSGYGGLRQTELPKPQPAKDRVLVRGPRPPASPAALRQLIEDRAVWQSRLEGLIDMATGYRIAVMGAGAVGLLLTASSWRAPDTM